MDRRYPPLSAALRAQLEVITPSDGLYYPCVASLNDGTQIDRVYLAQAERWFLTWGVWPDQDRGKRAIDIRDVGAVRESPSRLPAAFADQLYRAGESGMGYTIFTVRFSDGSSTAIVTGNAVDFIDYPPGQSLATVVEIVPHLGRDDPGLSEGPGYHWCLYGGDD